MKVNKDKIKEIELVRHGMSADSEESATATGTSPLKRYIKQFVNVDEFESLQEMIDVLLKFAIKDKIDEAKYMKKSFARIDEDELEIFKEFIIQVYDTEGELAFTTASLQRDKMAGLLRVEKKTLGDYEDSGATFTDRRVFDDFGTDDMINFPKSFSGSNGVFKEVTAGMQTKFYKKVTEMISEMDDDEREVMMKLVMMSEVASDAMNIINSMATVSEKLSEEKEDSGILDDDMDEDDIEESTLEIMPRVIEKSLLSIYESKKDAKASAEDIMEVLEDAELDVKTLLNVRYMFSGKFMALSYKDQEDDIYGAVTAVSEMLEDIDDDDRKAVTPILSGATYLSIVADVDLEDLIDVDCFKAGYSDIELIDPESEDFDIEIEDIIETDVSLGHGVLTHMFGALEKDDLLKQVSKKIIPKVSWEFFDNMADKDGKSVDVEYIASYISKVIEGDVIDTNTVAEAIYNAIK